MGLISETKPVQFQVESLLQSLPLKVQLNQAVYIVSALKMADILGPTKGEKIHLFLLNEHARKVGQKRKIIPNSIKKSPK